MTSRRKNILTCSAITLIIIFIYVPIRTGLLEQQFVKSVVSATEKIVISISAFEKDKRLQDKDLSRFYSAVKDKYPVALVTIADKKNKILKAGKNDKYIKSNTTFDTIIDSFVRDEYKVNKKNDFFVRYYDQNRYYIFVRNIADGKILVVFPYKLSMKLIIQLVLEILLICIFSIIITAVIFVRKNRHLKDFEKKTFQYIKTDVAQEHRGKEADYYRDIPEKKKSWKSNETDRTKSNLDSLTNYVYELFSYISKEYKSESVSLYLVDEYSSRLDKIFELKGNAFIKIDNSEFNSISMNREIMEELKNSSIILLDKGKKVTIPVLYRNALLGIINILRDKEFRGPEINDIKSRLRIIAKPLGENILLDVILNEENGSGISPS